MLRMDVNIIQPWQRVYGPFHKTSHSLHTNSNLSSKSTFFTQPLPSEVLVAQFVLHFLKLCTMVSENTTFALGWQRNSNFHLMHFKIKTWEMCRWRTFLLPFLPAFWLQGNDLFLSKFSFEKEYISVRMEFSTKRRKIYVEFPTVSFPAFCTFLFIGITLHPAFKSELLLGEDECFWDHR